MKNKKRTFSKSDKKNRTKIYSQTCPYGHLYEAVTSIIRAPFSCPHIENFI